MKIYLNLTTQQYQNVEIIANIKSSLGNYL